MNYSRVNTDTTRFLMPLLGYSKEEVITKDFVNAFLFTKENLNLKRVIVLVYKTPHFNKNKVATIIHGFYCYYFPIDKIIYKLFLNGKFSRFTLKQKKIILNFWNLQKHSKLHNILFPNDLELENITAFPTRGLLYYSKEIWQKPDTLKETFIPKNYELLTNTSIK